MEPDFSGYATKAGLKCSDDRIITPEAFKHMDGVQVPLVWQHGHHSAENVLGHAILEARADGVYAYGYFNETKQGLNAKKLVEHKDINKMSIYANQLVEKSKVVHHGQIREVSLVLAGANPGAKIDYVRVQHSEDPDDITVLDEEAVIHSGLLLHGLNEGDTVEDKTDDTFEKTEEASEEKDADLEHTDKPASKSVKEIFEEMTEEQQSAVIYLLGSTVEDNAGSAEHSDTNTDEAVASTETGDNEEGIAHQEGNTDMTRNVFDQAEKTGPSEEKHTLSHDAIRGIVRKAVSGGSLKAAVEDYALAHGITNIDVLFPDAKSITDTPELNKRRTEWVANVLDGTRHTPFSRVKSIVADLTQDEARAKGYIKGHYKKEEFFGVQKRVTTPTTVYKKQKLDRDDVLDITDFDVVVFLKGEMRIMLEEELARAILIGDGRDVSDEDKVKDPGTASEGAGIRSIVNDHELYVTTLLVNVDDANSNYEEVVDAVMDGMEYYKGTGTPTLYTTLKQLNKFKKAKDANGRRYYTNNAEVAEALGVDKIVTVEPMNEVSDLIGIIVNLADYNVGTDRGGEINMFDDFDIDYNAQKYLMETRLSGALVKVKSALVIKKTAAGNALVAPQKPSFVSSTGVVTIPAVTGVVYKNADTSATLSSGAQSALSAGSSLNVLATPASGYYFADNASDQWTFKRPAA
jgi:hypothetical protein